MLDYNAKLTAEESKFAEEHHDIVFSYLRSRRLPEDEFYDIAIFGYLRAVRKYLTRPDLREQYQFSTIAYRAMSCNVHHSQEYWRRAKRNRAVLALDEDRNTGELRNVVSEAVDNVIDFEAVLRQITPVQHRIASLRADGYCNSEIAAICGIKRRDVTAEMKDARCRIIAFRENSAAMAA